MVDLFLAEVGVGVGATRLLTVEARFNALHQAGGVQSYPTRVGLELETVRKEAEATLRPRFLPS
jgi:hypothetical protein